MPAPAPSGLLLVALLCLPALATATTVNRCEDADGNLTFTTLSCPTGHARSQQHAYNAPPGSAIIMLPPASPASAKPSGRPASGAEILVIGERDDGCGNRLSAEQRRQALMNRQTPPGMTLRDVESLLGKPDSVANNSGELRYTYKKKAGRSDNVTFDHHGCVKGKK